MIEVIQAPEQEVCLSGCDRISVTYQLVDEEPVTVEVDELDSEYLTDEFVIRKVGDEWLVNDLCDVIKLTYTLDGVVRTLEAFSIGENNGKPIYNIDVDDPVFKGFNVFWDVVNGWQLSILNYPSTVVFKKNSDTVNPVFNDWVYQSGPTGISNLSTELIKKQCNCVKVSFIYDETEYNYVLNYSGADNYISENYTFTDLTLLTVRIYLLDGIWHFSFSEDGNNQANYESINLISNEWVDQGGDFTVTDLITTLCNPQATLSEDTPCPFGTYTIEEDSIFESFEVASVCFTSKWQAVHHPIKWELQRKDAIVIGTTDSSGLFRLELSSPPPTGVQIGTAVDFYDTLGVKRSSVVNDISGNFIRVSTTIVFGVTVDFVIFPNLYTNYYIETSLMRNGTEEVTTLRTIPFKDGRATVDVHSALKTLALFDNTFNYTSITSFDLGMSGKYKLRFRECYNFTKQAYSALTDFHYWSNSAKQVRDLYGSNMAEYVGNLATPAKFLTVFNKPTNFIGFPFSLSYIVSGDFSRKLRRNQNGTTTEITLAIQDEGSLNRMRVGNTATLVKIEYSSGTVLQPFTYGGNLTETKEIKIYDECIQNPVCLSWLNTLGGREHWVFGYNQTHGLETSQGATFEPYIEDLQNARSNIFNLERFAQPTMTLNAVVDIEDIEGLKTILYSVCVEMWVNGNWIGVRPRSGSFFIRETRDTNAEIEFTIDLPYINIQVR
jgi:hypothetical protein